jgi:hypothetical protein
VHDIALLFAFSYNSLLVDGNIRFCMLILYPQNLLYLLINSNTFLVESLGFTMYKIISSAEAILLLPLLSSLIVLTCTSSVRLTRNDECVC